MPEGWERVHNPYTAEGRVDDARRFARSVNAKSNSTKRNRKVFTWSLVVLPILLLVVAVVAAMLQR